MQRNFITKISKVTSDNFGASIAIKSVDNMCLFERLGLFEKAIGYYKKYLPLGEYMNWTAGVIFANMKIKLLESNKDSSPCWEWHLL